MRSERRRLVLPLTDVPFGRRCCVSRKCFAPPSPSPTAGPHFFFFFFSFSIFNCHHCFYSSWEHLALLFLCLLHILRGEFLESVFVCVEPLRRWKLARTGWLSKRSQTPSQCFWVSDFRPSPSPSPSLSLSLSSVSLYLWACMGLFRQATLCQQPHITPSQARVRWRAPAWLMWSDG